MISRHYGARYRLTFRAWLYQRRNDQNAIGDIARVVMTDGCLNADAGNHRLVGYQRHLAVAHQASPQALEALRWAWEEYQQETAPAAAADEVNQ